MKTADPRFISFDALPVCDGQIDMLPIAELHSSRAEGDNRWLA